MTSTLRTLLSELDRPDLPDAAKQVVQLEIEKLLGRNAREILEMLENSNRQQPNAVRLHKKRRLDCPCGFIGSSRNIVEHRMKCPAWGEQFNRQINEEPILSAPV